MMHICAGILTFGSAILDPAAGELIVEGMTSVHIAGIIYNVCFVCACILIVDVN